VAAAGAFVRVLRDGHVRGPPPGLHAGAVSYGPVLNAAAVLLSACGNVPSERSAQLIGMPLGTGVSAGWVDKAVARVSARLEAAGFGDAMTAALAAEDVLDKSPLPAPAPDEADPEEKDGTTSAGAPHVLIVRTPDGRLTFLRAIGSRRKGSVGGGVPAAFAGYLITDGHTGYQHLLSRIAGIQQCARDRGTVTLGITVGLSAEYGPARLRSRWPRSLLRPRARQ
jgi:hypothetical protein